MINPSELELIQTHIDTLARATGSPHSKTTSYQHKILQLLLQQKTTALDNQKLSTQLADLYKQNANGEEKFKRK